jgi:hypothetical protein
MMFTISCKSGKTFLASSNSDAEWKLNAAYYVAQGCIEGTSESVEYCECKCDHCKSLEHEFEELLDER